MIVVLHGDDTASSYERLSQILEKYADFQKINLPLKATLNQLTEVQFSQNLFSEQKLIIAEDFLTNLTKIPAKYFFEIPKESNLIFWEKKALSPSKVQKLAKIAKIEIFKQKTELFTFLDSLAPTVNTSRTIQELEGTPNLLWHLENRILLLICSKLGMNYQKAQMLTHRNIFDWQWNRIKNQSTKFSLESLIAFYKGALKIDFMIKSGKTDLPQNTLISVLLLKYLH